MRKLLSYSLPLLVALSPLASCKSKASKPAPADDAAAVVPPTDARPVTMTTTKERPQHFAFLTAAKDSLLFSDLVGARDSLAWVANEDNSEPHDEKWKVHSAELQTTAAAAEGSESVATLSGAVAKFAHTCGACHKDLGVTPEVKVKEPKHRGQDFKEHMAGHKWALDKMWAGLATPSDEHWIEGAKLLADAPTHLRSLSAYGDDADRAMELATEVHGLAAQATTETGTEARVEIFGKFLAACAGCHELPGSAPNEE